MSVHVVAVSLVPANFNKSTFSPEFARIAVLQSSYKDPMDTNMNMLTIDPYLDSLHITECTLGLTGYKYSSVSASGNQLNIKSDPIPLQPTPWDASQLMYSDLSMNYTLDFNEPDLPPLQVGAGDLLALGQFFESSRFSGKIWGGPKPPAPPEGIGLALKGQNVSEILDILTVSMTDYLRSNYDAPANGFTIGSEIYVHVRWAWLTLPFSVLVAAAVLLQGTIISTHRHQCHLWKSSVVAMLYHTVLLDNENAGVLRSNVQNVKEMEKLAHQTKAKLG